VSTVQAEKDPDALLARLRGSDSSAPRQYHAPALPEEWPRSWRDEYRFPLVLPEVAERIDSAPRQIDLDKLFEFLLFG